MRPEEAPTGTADLSADQTPSSPTVEEPDEAIRVTVLEVEQPEPVMDAHPALIPEWVPKLQWIASGAALFFAAVAIVVERHEQRFHRDES